METTMTDRTCFECGKRFPNPSKLERHMVVHSGLKPYVCQFCNRGFTQKSYMKRHEIMSHMKEFRT